MWVEIPDGTFSAPRRRGSGGMVICERTRTIDATVFRIARIATVRRQLVAAVEVDAFIPEMYRSRLPQVDGRWIEPGVFRAKAYVLQNKKCEALAQFLESGAMEIDLREREI
ncbi:hypothetical protein [Burkholderia stabilis]|jgi:hypothetical protein|uniref:Gp64 n=2 Tax=Burkholderia vietnamiensis TaxID=60552 RepID=A0ABS1ATM5_BURVI|nr:hypothetical protein [Burkholderia vietnamiensis]